MPAPFPGSQGYQQVRRRLLRRLLQEVCPLLDAAGIPYWADFGTLLGMYREKDLILYDNDADIVVSACAWLAVGQAAGGVGGTCNRRLSSCAGATG